MRLFYFSVVVLFLFASANGQDRLKIEPDQRFLILETQKTSTMQKELDEAAAKGFRVLFSGGGASGLFLYLERPDQVKDTYKYRLLATSKIVTMQKEMSEAAKEGFRLLPRTLIFNFNLLTFETVLVMEQNAKSSERYEYVLFGSNKLSKLQKEIAETQNKGYTFIGAMGGIVIMEKEVQTKQ